MSTKKRMWFNGALCGLALTLLLVFGMGLYSRYRVLESTRQQLEQCRKEQRKIVSKNIELVNTINYRDTDEYIEKIARDQLGLVKPNEIVFIDDNE